VLSFECLILEAGCNVLEGPKDEVDDASESREDISDESVDSKSDLSLVSSSL